MTQATMPNPTPFGPAQPMEITELSGLLSMDRTRGKYHQFILSDPRTPYVQHQIAFPDNLFVRVMAGRTRVQQLGDKGRELWRQLFLLVGKGVKVTGIGFPDQVQQDRGGPFATVMRFLIDVVEACPQFDPRPPKMRPAPVKPKEIVEAEAEEEEKRLAAMTPKDKALFAARQVFNESCAQHAMDLTVEKHMMNEFI